jgi:hypothetical protein
MIQLRIEFSGEREMVSQATIIRLTVSVFLSTFRSEEFCISSYAFLNCGSVSTFLVLFCLNLPVGRLSYITGDKQSVRITRLRNTAYEQARVTKRIY